MTSPPRFPRFPGFHDPEGRFVSFLQLQHCFARARAHNVRVVVRLELTERGELRGRLHARARSKANRSAA